MIEIENPFISKESKIIKEIHDSKLFGTIVEMGCASPVANSLLMVPGASKTIYESLQPYSKESQEKQFDIKDRSVSLESTYQILCKQYSKTKQQCNFHLVLTFQISEETDKISHGWIGLYNGFLDKKNFEKINLYHITILDLFERETIINRLSYICINLLNHLLYDTKPNDFKSKFGLDQYYYCDSLLQTPKTSVSRLIELNNEENLNNYLLFDNFTPKRIVDFLRNSSEGIIIFRGSFNPIHEGHIEILNACQEQLPTYDMVFCLSLDVYEKGKVKVDDIIERIFKINSLGYKVLVTFDKFFVSDYQYFDSYKIYNQFKDLKIIHVIGEDTAQRICESSLQDYHYANNFIKTQKDNSFYIYERITDKKIDWKCIFDQYQVNYVLNNEYKDSGISSTKIRNGEMITKI